MRRRLLLLVVSALAIVLVAGPSARALPDPGEVPPPDPAPGSAEWTVRDVQNIAHAHGRLRDEYVNPAFTTAFWRQTPETYFTNLRRQLEHPERPILTAAQLIPGGTTADPYRTTWEEQGRGVRYQLSFLNRYGARLRANLWAPNPDASDPVTGAAMKAPYPAVVITTGSIQGYQDLYLWAAQGLAEAGYVVLTYDVQGQGESETFGHDDAGNIWCNGFSTQTPPPPSPGGAEQNASCPGVPFQQQANFVNGTEDALDFFFSSSDEPYRWYRSGTDTVAYNPMSSIVDLNRVGIAGHSLGATAVSIVQAYDDRVNAVVAWDNLAASAAFPPRAPSMGQNAEYFLNAQPTTTMPAPKDGAYNAWKNAGVDTMQIALTGATHLEWTYVPYILPASQKGERLAMHYTLAWFDRYLKGSSDAAQRTDATRRLTAQIFDGSADASAIGAGDWDAGSNTNEPHTISGERVWSELSFYSPSGYWLDGGALSCEDMRRNTAC